MFSPMKQRPAQRVPTKPRSTTVRKQGKRPLRVKGDVLDGLLDVFSLRALAFLSERFQFVYHRLKFVVGAE